MKTADFLVIGGGIAGLSAAARLAEHGQVIVIEGEDSAGYHSSGRSVSFSHFGIGNRAVRGLTAWSRTFFETPPEDFATQAIAHGAPSLYFADEGSVAALKALHVEMAQFTDAIEPIDRTKMHALCPILRIGPGAAVGGLLDPTGLKLDADALLQGFVRTLKRRGGVLLMGTRIASVEQGGEKWRVATQAGDAFEAPVLVDAAGAWADVLARLAGVRPLGLQPKRRTIIVVDPPAGVDIARWPFVHSAAGDFYMLPEAGRLLVSPVDEVEDDPCDAAPDDYDIALAADRLEHYTEMKVTRIAHRWAGLRSFVADRTPTAGFAPDAPGFFWLAGQGGYGFQTAPAMAAIVEALVMGGAWPDGLAELGVTRDMIEPGRLLA